MTRPNPLKSPGGWRGSPNTIRALKTNWSHLPKCSQCKALARKGSLFCWRHEPAGVVPGQQNANNGTNRVSDRSYDVRSTLAAIASDPEANANARTAAARTLAELDGLLGRHSAAPERTADRLLSSLSRVELARELARLRASCAEDKALKGG
jgi:hypothetical protein